MPRLFQKAGNLKTEHELIEQRRRICSSLSPATEKLLADQAAPAVLQICRGKDVPEGNENWRRAAEALGWEAQKKRVEILEARLRIQEQLDLAEDYVSHKNERQQLKKTIQGYEKKLQDVDRLPECRHADASLSRACDKVRQDIRELISKTRELDAAKSDFRKKSIEARTQKHMHDEVAAAIDAWKSNDLGREHPSWAWADTGEPLRYVAHLSFLAKEKERQVTAAKARQAALEKAVKEGTGKTHRRSLKFWKNATGALVHEARRNARTEASDGH